MKCNAIIYSLWGTQMHKIGRPLFKGNVIALGAEHSISRVLVNDNNYFVELCTQVCYSLGQDSKLISQE